MQRQPITGFILAGGQSRRMGADKAQLPWSSGTFLSHAVEILGDVASSVVVVGGSASAVPDVSVLPDQFSGRGPLAGIHAALSHTKTDWNLILAVDMPLVTPALFSFIAEKCASSSAIAIVPQTGGRLQPLCAAYRRQLLPKIQKAIDAGELSIHRLLESLSTGIMEENPGGIRVLREDELTANDFRLEMLMNVNTPEDFGRARQVAQELNV